MSLSQSRPLMPLHSAAGFHPACGAHRAPPLHFGRRPPQSNYPPCSVPRPADGRRLEAKNVKGGISRLAPPKLAPRFRSLPPILHMPPLAPLQSCSKGAQGLSVLPRVLGIFIEIAVSLSPWPRQRGDRYAIRAGRNLPDKEFRYLRTVIVTAAVYRGFGFPLRLAANGSP